MAHCSTVAASCSITVGRCSRLFQPIITLERNASDDRARRTSSRSEYGSNTLSNCAISVARLMPVLGPTTSALVSITTR